MSPFDLSLKPPPPGAELDRVCGFLPRQPPGGGHPRFQSFRHTRGPFRVPRVVQDLGEGEGEPARSRGRVGGVEV